MVFALFGAACAPTLFGPVPPMEDDASFADGGADAMETPPRPAAPSDVVLADAHATADAALAAEPA